jgi:hypothetical protein
MTPATKHLRALNTPRRITVDAAEDGRPAAVTFGRRKLAVEAHHETWRIDDEWWRAKPVSRMYWRVSLEDGRVVDVYRDLVTGAWYRQSYG